MMILFLENVHVLWIDHVMMDDKISSMCFIHAKKAAFIVVCWSVVAVVQDVSNRDHETYKRQNNNNKKNVPFQFSTTTTTTTTTFGGQ